jgi:hypothetical protein
MVTSRGGAPRRCRIAVADTGSVGPTIAPSTNATAHGRPAAKCATNATAATVASTSPTASSRIGTAFERNSSTDERYAAE